MLYTAPLVDVVLLLIIFFLFASNLVLKSGVEVKLPAAGSPLPASVEAHILAVIGGETESLFFNDRRISFSELDETLEAARERSTQVILLGDEGISYGLVMRISQSVLRKGFELSFATQQESQ